MIKRTEAITVVHPKRGIYLGVYKGYSFWSLGETCGQTHAYVFHSEKLARKFISSWLVQNNPDAYKYKKVLTINPHYATPEELIAAGLIKESGILFLNKLDQGRKVYH